MDKKKVYEIKRETVRTKTDKERIIFIRDDEDTKWLYHAPNAQNHTEEQVEEILDKLRELNGQKS